MALSVEVNLEAYPQGIPLGIVGIGVVENGGTIEVPPEMEEVFHSINGDTIENVLAEQEGMDVSGSAEWEAPPPEEVESEPEATVETTTTTPEPETVVETTTSGSGLPPGTGGDA